ncbi:MAG TPA: hypothetical protein VML94_07970 [Thermoplasmata archaeon]|nr:hypothetical protein [Thermoplasmata archaeon]
MNLESVLSLVAGIIALAVALTVFRVYLIKRKVHHLLWAVGMVLWSASDFTQLYALVVSWNVPVYLLYFLCSIMLAGLLGAGTLYLVAPGHRISTYYFWFNVACAVILAILLVTTPVNKAALQTAVVGANAITSAYVGLVAAVVNTPALFTFVGGAAYSFVKTRRLYALLITIGSALAAFGGILATALLPQFLPYTDFVGVSFLGAGFFLTFK